MYSKGSQRTAYTPNPHVSHYYSSNRPRPTQQRSEPLRQDVGFIVEHRLPLENLCNMLETDLTSGLSNEMWKSKLRALGANQITPPSGIPEIVKLLKHAFGGFQLIIWIGVILASMCFIIQAHTHEIIPMQNLYLTIVLFLLIVLSAGLGYYLEVTSSNISKAFYSVTPKMATVIRANQKQRISADQLVPGDLVEVAMGETIPADIRLVTAQSFRVDNSALTGDSEPQLRVPELVDPHVNAIFSSNMAFYGTVCVDGFCTGLVCYTGDNTLLGRIANLAASVEKEESPISRETENFLLLVTSIGLILAVIVFLIAFYYFNYYWLEAVIFFIGTSLACAPLGFFVVYTVCIYAVANRLKDRGFYIKNPSALSMIGSVSTICADKTGTLTENKLSISKIWMDDVFFELDHGSYYRQSRTWPHLVTTGLMTNRAQFQHLEDEQKTVRLLGDPIDVALLVFMESSLSQLEGSYDGIEQFRHSNPVTAEIPFNPKKKFHMTFARLQSQHEHQYMMKGAPEVVLSHSQYFMVNGSIEKITPENKAQIDHAYRAICADGERVLAFAYKVADIETVEQLQQQTETPSDLVFLGLISFRDPPRPGTANAIKACKRAGLKVVMITGDHPITAEAVAKQVGIITGKTLKDVAAARGIPIQEVHPSDSEVTAGVVNGSSLQYQGEINAFIARYKELVFARTTPEQKNDIVSALQDLGEVVAVTGDGVNDAVALRRANVGFSMGLDCSDVCKESSDILVATDFGSIVYIIEEGQLIYNNLKKCLRLIMTSNIPQALAFALFVIMNIPLPLGTVGILLIDLVINMLPAIGLAFEKPERASVYREDKELMVTMSPSGDSVGMYGWQAGMMSGGDSDVKSLSAKMEDKCNNEPSVRKKGLLNSSLIALAYGLFGMLETFACFTIYFIVMAQYGFWPKRIIGLRYEWDSVGLNDLEDSYGQQWTYAQRKRLEYTAQAAFFGGIVMLQLLNALLAKMRWTSISRMDLSNLFFWIALPISLVLAILFIYVPGLNGVLGLQGPYVYYYFVTYPLFLILMAVLDETRRFLIRRYVRYERAVVANKTNYPFSFSAFHDWFY